MIEREIYSTNAFLKILNKNEIHCELKSCNLFKDYIIYNFEMKEDKKINEFQIYSVIFSITIESENSCFFIGKKGKHLAFMLTFTNDLKKYGLQKTPETLGKIPKEKHAFDFVKKPLERMVWYKLDMKNIGEQKVVNEFGADAQNAEERYLLDACWKEIAE